MSTTNVYIPSCADFKTNLRKASPAAGSCLLKSDDKYFKCLYTFLCGYKTNLGKASPAAGSC